MDRDPLLAAFVCVSGNGGAQTLAVPPAVTVAGVRQTVPIEPGHIHLGGAHTHTHTHTLWEWQVIVQKAGGGQGRSLGGSDDQLCRWRMSLDTTAQ